MSTDRWLGIFDVARPVIGMVHLPALPGAPGYAGSLEAIRQAVARDVDALLAGGVHGLMIENFGDTPFFADSVPPATIAHMTGLARLVRERTERPIGINVLRNDAPAALAIAHAVGAEFIRVNVLCGARLTDQGIITGQAAALLRLRAALGADGRGDSQADMAPRIAILADVNVKHAAPLAAVPVEQEAGDLLHRGGADGLIVSGTGTGRTTAGSELTAVKQAAGDSPVLVGSGVHATNLSDYIEAADGFIVGSSLKRDGQPTAPVDGRRVAALMAAWREAAGR